MAGRDADGGETARASSISLNFCYAVRNLVPKNWCQAIKRQLTCAYLDVSMERHDKMFARLLPGNTNIANNAANSAARNENTRAFPPYTIQFGKKTFVVFDVTQLLIMGCILL